jgi:hypothetical protein
MSRRRSPQAPSVTRLLRRPRPPGSRPAFVDLCVMIANGEPLEQVGLLSDCVLAGRVPDSSFMGRWRTICDTSSAATSRQSSIGLRRTRSVT